MQDILKSTLLEYGKSSFLIDLIKYSTGSKFIKIQQTITDHDEKQEIKINASILMDIISVLVMYQKELPLNTKSKNYFSEKRQQEIVRNYLKGISIKDLTLTYNYKKEILEQILINKNIEIVDNEIPRYYGYKKFGRKKK